MSQTVLGLKLSEALQKSPAGATLKKPLMERIWLYVKDHPGVLSSRLHKILKEESSAVSSLVLQMTKREMLVREKQSQPYRGAPSFYLRVNPKMRGVYELLPKPKKPNTQIAVSVQTLPQAPAPAVVSESKEKLQPVNAETFDLESLTIREARQLQVRLYQLFGGK